jgi:hypothetical protein
MAVIDADAHVVETERTWEYMEEAESLFKPEVVVPKAGGGGVSRSAHEGHPCKVPRPAVGLY